MRYTYLSFDTRVVSLLKALRRHYSIGLITNGPSRSQWEKLCQLKAENLFDMILVSGDLRWEKPQAEIFHLACEKLRVLPVKSVMVGDRLDTDIAGGKLAGLAATVWIPLSADDAAKVVDYSSPDFTIGHILDLASIFGMVVKE